MNKLACQDNPMAYTPAAKTNVYETFKKHWERLGQVPPDQDPKIQEERRRVRELATLADNP